MNYIYLAVVAPGDIDGINIEIKDIQEGILIASFLEHYCNLKCMVSEGETYEDSQAVYITYPEVNNESKGNSDQLPDEEKST